MKKIQLLLVILLICMVTSCGKKEKQTTNYNELESGISAIEDAMDVDESDKTEGSVDDMEDLREGTSENTIVTPDELDQIPAHASADGMIYSFYGRLSVGNMDQEWLKEGDLPPTFYVYGTEDPFYDQFERQYQVLRDMGIRTERIVLNGWPHGFGSDGGWVQDYANWLEDIFHNKDNTVTKDDIT